MSHMSQHTNLVIFVGAIPAEIGQLSKLEVLNLNGNGLSGKLHSWCVNGPVTNTNLVIFCRSDSVSDWAVDKIDKLRFARQRLDR